jgi:hypothetical protein
MCTLYIGADWRLPSWVRDDFFRVVCDTHRVVCLASEHITLGETLGTEQGIPRSAQRSAFDSPKAGALPGCATPRIFQPDLGIRQSGQNSASTTAHGALTLRDDGMKEPNVAGVGDVERLRWVLRHMEPRNASEPAKESGVVVRAVNWLFRNRRTGRITVAQWPNIPLWGFLLGSLVLRFLHPSGSVEAALRIGAVSCLLIWAADELIRGVNPFRRFLGVAVMLGTVAAFILR